MLLLNVLAECTDGGRLSELARRAGLHHATAHRLLATLAAARLVEHDAGKGRYRLGLRILELAGTMVENLEIRSVARPILLGLARATGETVHLATLDGEDMVFLDRIDGVQPVTLRTRVGFRAPAHVTAVGKAFLAFSSPLVVEKFLNARPLARFTGRTITDRQAFVRHLALVRRAGYAVDYEEHRATIRCVGAPIFDHLGVPVAALSIAAPMFRLSQRRIRERAKLVKAAAGQVSEALGHRAVAKEN
jgi:DNA-binding IclR family transcriptional regulator